MRVQDLERVLDRVGLAVPHDGHRRDGLGRCGAQQWIRADLTGGVGVAWVEVVDAGRVGLRVDDRLARVEGHRLPQRPGPGAAPGVGDRRDAVHRGRRLRVSRQRDFDVDRRRGARRSFDHDARRVPARAVVRGP